MFQYGLQIRVWGLCFCFSFLPVTWSLMIHKCGSYWQMYYTCHFMSMCHCAYLCPLHQNRLFLLSRKPTLCCWFCKARAATWGCGPSLLREMTMLKRWKGFLARLVSKWIEALIYALAEKRKWDSFKSDQVAFWWSDRHSIWCTLDYTDLQ